MLQCSKKNGGGEAPLICQMPQYIFLLKNKRIFSITEKSTLKTIFERYSEKKVNERKWVRCQILRVGYGREATQN